MDLKGFETSMRIEAGYDHRDQPKDHVGAAGAKLILILKGELGAIATIINTGWMRYPLVKKMVWEGSKQERRLHVGVDAGVWDVYPTGAHVESHCYKPQGDNDTSGYGPCALLGTDVCYGQCGYTTADEVLEIMVEKGSDAAFLHMAELYKAWIKEATFVEGL